MKVNLHVSEIKCFMVNALDSGSGGPASSHGLGTVLGYWAKQSRSGEVLYNAGGNPNSGYQYQSRGGEERRNTSCRLMLGNRVKLRNNGPLGSYADLTNLPVLPLQIN